MQFFCGGPYIIKERMYDTENVPVHVENDDTASTSNINPLKCDECDDVISNGQSLKDHKKFYHEWLCDFCEYRTKTSLELENHVLAEHECVICSFKSSCFTERARHMSEEHTLVKLT
jgi:hypothetical protein